MNKLSAAERAIFEKLLQAKPLYARRARLLLAWDDGLSPATLAEQAPLSPARVRYWLSRFASLRLQVFPPKVLAAVSAPVAGDAQNDRSEALPGNGNIEENKAPLSATLRIGDDLTPGSGAKSVVVSDNKPLPPAQSDTAIVAPSKASSLVPDTSNAIHSVRGDVVAPPTSRPTKPGLTSGDPMAEAGRKILRFHFLRMLDHEAGARSGEDTEHLHDMRVATRRLRAAFVLFGSYYASKASSTYVKWLRRIGRALGAVRDLDVFLEKTGRYLQTLPDAERTSLDPLLASWRAKREQARRQMLALLDSPRYQGFCRAFDLFTSTPGLGVQKDEGEQPTPIILAHIAPMLVYQRLAEVRAFESLLPSAPVTLLHQLRIACKRLRYTLEFLEETLGSEAKEVIKEVVVMQDHLGNLQDAVVATDLLRGFLNEWAERQKSDGATQHIEIHGVTRYLAAKQSETFELLKAFPAAWQRLNDPRLRDKLARALSAL